MQKVMINGLSFDDEPEKVCSEGRKDDDTKLRFDLIPPDVMSAIAIVLTKGAKKYGDRNWEQGIKYSRCLAAMQRHLYKWQLGDPADKESGQHHLAHVCVNAMFMLAFEIRGNHKLDDVTTGRHMTDPSEYSKGILDFVESE